MGNRYVWTKQNFTPVAATCVVQFTPLTTRRGRVWQVIIGGLGTTSAAQQIAIGRPAAIGITPATNVAPDQFEHGQQPAASGNYWTTFGTQPTAIVNPVLLGWNALGGSIIWNAPAGGNKLEVVGIAAAIAVMGLAAGVTYQACSLSVIVEED